MRWCGWRDVCGEGTYVGGCHFGVLVVRYRLVWMFSSERLMERMYWSGNGEGEEDGEVKTSR